jgi:hypothetical protein
MVQQFKMESPAFVELVEPIKWIILGSGGVAGVGAGAWWIFKEAVKDPAVVRRLPDWLDNWEEGWHELRRNRRRRALERVNTSPVREYQVAPEPRFGPDGLQLPVAAVEEPSEMVRRPASEVVRTDRGGAPPLDRTIDRFDRDLKHLRAITGPIHVEVAEGIPDTPPWEAPQ